MSTTEKGKNIFLIAVDGEPHSFQAFDWYLNYIYNPGHEVALMHVYKAPNDGSDDESCQQEYEAKRQREALIYSFQQVSMDASTTRHLVYLWEEANLYL